MLGADRFGCLEPLVGMGRRHPDIDDRDVGMELSNGREELGRIACLRDDVEPGFSEQPGDTLAKQDGVIGEGDPNGHQSTDRRAGQLVLRDEPEDAAACQARPVLARDPARRQHDERRGPVDRELPGDLETLHIRQSDVEEDEVRPEGSSGF